MKLEPVNVTGASDGYVLVGERTIVKLEADSAESFWGSSLLISVTIGLGECAGSDFGYRMRLSPFEARRLAGLLIEGAAKSEGSSVE